MNAPDKPAARRATNLNLEAALVDEARRLGVNLSRAAEAGLRRAVAEEAARRWQQENAEGIRQMNAWVEKHGLPLAKYRMF
jgi:antitoxin CcdA